MPTTSDKKLKKILIVEDEKPMAHALELKLSHSGFETVIASDGEAALENLKKQKFDLVLLDLMIPKLDGFGVMKAMKENKDKTPVIVSSNLGQEDDAQKAKSMGAKWYFVKSDTPINKIVDYIVGTLMS
ncbi:MAG: response regulator [Candidatus Magasanikbacteria bacterium]|jgi:DNA-binding response OmpR family regulator